MLTTVSLLARPPPLIRAAPPEHFPDQYSLMQFISQELHRMRVGQNAVFSALERAKGFTDDNLTELTSVDLAAVRKRLDDIVASFTTHAFDQNANDRDTKGETAKQQQLRVALTTDVMRPIAEIARRNLRNVPEFKALQMPRRVVGPAFLASAEGMADAATKYTDVLIERGLPANFLDEFQTAVVAFAASVNDREKSRTRRMGATQALAELEQEGRSVLKVLDALVRRALRGNAALLGTWKGARAIHRRPGGPAASPSTPTATTEATPTATPVSSTPTPPIVNAT